MRAVVGDRVKHGRQHRLSRRKDSLVLAAFSLPSALQHHAHSPDAKLEQAQRAGALWLLHTAGGDCRGLGRIEALEAPVENLAQGTCAGKAASSTEGMNDGFKIGCAL